MALLSILQYPDTRLRKHAQPVQKVDSEIRTLVDNMFETMYEYSGVGLASIQVNVPHRVIVIDVSENQKHPLCVINPEIITRSDDIQHDSEGCLSFPGVYDKVDRAAKIRLRALDQQGKTYEIDAEGLLAVCIQHEMDHLDGVLFIDHLSRLRQERIRKKLEKIRRRTL